MDKPTEQPVTNASPAPDDAPRAGPSSTLQFGRGKINIGNLRSAEFAQLQAEHDQATRERDEALAKHAQTERELANFQAQYSAHQADLETMHERFRLESLAHQQKRELERHETALRESDGRAELATKMENHQSLLSEVTRLEASALRVRHIRQGSAITTGALLGTGLAILAAIMTPKGKTLSLGQIGLPTAAALTYPLLRKLTASDREQHAQSLDQKILQLHERRARAEAELNNPPSETLTEASAAVVSGLVAFQTLKALGVGSRK